MPPAPPLAKAYEVRPQVFGFPVTQDELQAWAEAHDIKPGKQAHIRYHAALRAIGAKLPRDCRRISVIKDTRTGSTSMCFVVGTNRNAQEMQPTKDVKRLKSLYDMVEIASSWPGWFFTD